MKFCYKSNAWDKCLTSKTKVCEYPSKHTRQNKNEKYALKMVQSYSILMYNAAL